MERYNVKDIDSLIQGIKGILSKYRCSFSEDEKVLLFDCLAGLRTLKRRSKQQKIVDVLMIFRVVELLMRAFEIGGHIIDIH
jgi:hypothetical protein